MVEYPSVIPEGNRSRLFYCGNGYGATGIGTATSSPLRATGRHGPCLARIVASATGASWDYRLPEGLSAAEGVFKIHNYPVVGWHGPGPDGAIWHEWQTNDDDFKTITAYQRASELGIHFIQGIHYCVIITPREYGLALLVCATNVSPNAFHNLVVFPCLGHPSQEFRDPRLERTFIVAESGITALKDTDRGTGDPRRTHFHVAGSTPVRFFGPSFCGEASRTVASSGAIVRTSESARFSIGTTWERVAEIFHNEDDHHCIHSVGTLGDLAPGQTKTLRGWIVFIEGAPERAFDLLEALDISQAPVYF